MNEMRFLRMNEKEEIYFCVVCKENKTIPKGADLPFCDCDEYTSKVG